jgi:hypothetical protein
MPVIEETVATSNVSFATRRSSVGRTSAGLAALVYPVLMVVLAFAVGSRRGGDLQDFAASFVAAMMFVIALPTTWLLSFDFIDVSRATVLIFGVVTSLPLWYLLGTALGARVVSWGRWLQRYITIALVWTIGILLLLAVIAALGG